MKFVFTFLSLLLILHTSYAQNEKKISSDSSKKNDLLNNSEKRRLIILKNEGKLIEGKMVDINNQPIPFGTVALKGTAIGTVADEYGNFLIKVPFAASDTLVFSHVAFQAKEYSIRTIETNLIIKLEEKNVKLPEIIISDGRSSSLDILIEAIDRIEDNYWQGPYSMSVIQRSMQVDSVSSSIFSIDWVGEAYFPDGYSKARNGLFKVKNARKGKFDSDKQQFNYGFYKTSWRDFLGLFLLDQVLYRKNSFLNKRNHKHFTFELSDIISDDDTLFKLEFVCNQISPNTATYAVHQAKYYKGTVFINASDYGITKVESEIVWDVNELSKNRMKGLDKNLKTLVLRNSVEYAKENGYYFLSKSTMFENYNEIGFRDFTYFDKKIGLSGAFENLYETRRKDYDEKYWSKLLRRIN